MKGNDQNQATPVSRPIPVPVMPQLRAQLPLPLPRAMNRSIPMKSGSHDSGELDNSDDPDQLVDYNEQMMRMMEKQCYHSNHYYYGGQRGDNNVCGQLCDLISVCYSEGIAINAMTFNKFCRYISGNTMSYGSDNTCIAKNKARLSGILALLFGSFVPDIKMLGYLMQFTDYDDVHKFITDNPNFKYLTHEYIEKFVDVRLKNAPDKAVDNDQIARAVLESIDTDNIDKKTIDTLLLSKNQLICDKLKIIIDSYSNAKCPLDSKTLDIACHSLPFTKTCINSIVQHKVQFESKHLVTVCMYGNLEAIEFILQQSRLTVTGVHFKAIIDSTMAVAPDKRYGPVTRVVQETARNAYSDEKFELLVRYGYVPCKDDIIYSIRKKITIRNVDRFGIDFNEQILKACHEVNFYPPYKFTCVNIDLLRLQQLCRVKNVKNVRDFLGSHNIVPDEECVRKAAQIRNNDAVYKTLKKFGGTVTYECLKSADANCTSFMMDMIRDYGIVNDLNVKKIADLESKVKALESQVLRMNIDECAIFEDGDDLYAFVDLDSKPKSGSKFKFNSNCDNSDNSDNSDSIGDDPDTEIVVKGNRIIKIIENKTIKHNNPNIDTLSPERILSIQKQGRVQLDIPVKFSQAFGIDKKKKMSYIDMKQYILDKVRKDKWMDKTNPTVINIPAKIAIVLELKGDHTINFADIDRFVCMFY